MMRICDLLEGAVAICGMQPEFIVSQPLGDRRENFSADTLHGFVKVAPLRWPAVRMLGPEIRVALLRELLREISLGFKRAREHDDGSLCFQEVDSSTRRSCALLRLIEFCAECRH